jgi:hypothetical protein
VRIEAVGSQTKFMHAVEAEARKCSTFSAAQRFQPGGNAISGFGASRPLRRIPAIVSFLNPEPALSLVGGNRS